MERKAYSKPTILRVQLNHEQAVLSQCSVGVTTLRQGGVNSCRGGGNPCKKSNISPGEQAPTS